MNFLTPFLGYGAALAALLAAPPGHAQTGPPPAGVEWCSYAGTPGSAKYSPLAQIDSTNFKKLHIAWTWRSVEEQITAAHPELHSWSWETTPLMVGGVLYLSTSLSQAVALDATHGRRKRKGLVPAASLW